MAIPNATQVIEELPNLFTPMAFLPPDIAYQTTIGSYILIGSLGAFVWDLLTNLQNDYKLLFKCRIGLPTAVYFLSRVSSLFYVLASTIFETAPIGRCALLEKIVDIMYPISVSSTCLLFFFRIRAVFDRSNIIVALFFVVWLSVVGGTLTIVTAVKSINIGPTNYCLNASLKSYASAAGITPLIHDTLVFVAISLRLLMNSRVDWRRDWKLQARAFVTGEYLPVFSRALLQDGQLYFMFTVGSNLLTVAMVYATGVPVTYRTMFTVPNIMLTNSMSCRVFRNTKFGLFRDISMSTMATHSSIRAGSIPLSLRNNSSRGENDTNTDISGTTVKISKVVEYATV
ncbi:hypothetical protein CERSUDRAFT_96777 [Gelatoporia subvermispora B]|uniref:Uncharacterized protein n=1 Tax=Ceriporiopsis subvermispora (strain B) TaxID=914234 RepID=M2QUA5_CERS8|nr:hypothetical protein CERSUDRAFT_96777 [Gelatoporia subvermispora B]